MEISDNDFKNIEYANFGHRLLASIVDFFVILIPILGSVYYVYIDKNLLFVLISHILIMLYKPLMEGLYGATLGKMVLGIKVVDSDFESIDLVKSFTKNAIYLASSLISILSIFWMFDQDAFLEAEGFLESSIAVQENPYQLISALILLLILISCFIMLASDRNQTLHDKIAKTLCIRK